MARRLVKRGDSGDREPPRQRQEPERKVEIPIDPINEQVLIVAAVLDADTRKSLAQRLKPEAFLVEKHVPIWTALREISRLGLDYSVEAVRQVGGAEVDLDYIVQLVGGRERPPPNVAHHVDRLAWDRARAEAASALHGLIGALSDPLAQPERVRSLARQTAEVLESGGGYRHLMRDPDRLLKEASAELVKFRDGAAYHPYGVPGLDEDETGARRLVIGAAPGKVTVISGISGGGKSTLTMQIARAQAAMGQRVLYGAWEMAPRTTLQMMACQACGISRTRALEGRLTDDEHSAVDAEMDAIKNCIRFVDQPAGKRRGERRSNDDVLDDVHGMIVDSGCDIAFFDLWDRAFRFRGESEERETLSRQQAIAEETGCHVVLVQQQKLKEVEQRDDKRPTRDTIKGSSAWVDVADTILGVHLPSLWKAVPDDSIEVIVLKQRYGRWPLLVEADWQADSGLITACRSGSFRSLVEQNDLDAMVDRSKGKGGRRGNKN